MLQPLLLIGIGGSGGKTLRAIKLELQQRLVVAGMCEEIPGAWQFLHIDSVSNQDGNSFPAPMLTSEEFQTVAPQGITIREAMKFVSGSGSINDAQSLLAGWGPEAFPIPINTSPSGERAAGRVFGIAQMERIHQAIKHSLSKALGPDSSKELEKFVGSKAELKITNLPKVIIFTSSGGFTGSGLVIDVQEIVRRVVPDIWSQGLVTFLYSEEVFKSVPRGMLANFTMNTFGLLNELTARANGVMTERSEALYNRNGLVPHGGDPNRVGSIEQNIFIGNNEHEMNACIYAFSKEITSAICEGRIYEFSEQKNLLQFGQVNFENHIRTSSSGLVEENEVNYNSKISSQPSLWKSTFFSNPLHELYSQFKVHPVSNTGQENGRKVLGSLDHYVVLNNEPSYDHNQYFDHQRWRRFTSGRRSRPIEEAIPLGNELRRSMITGWFIATFFGLRDINSSDTRRTVRVWNTSQSPHGWTDFPNPLVSGSNRDLEIESWVLPQLMLSIGIALTESATSGSQDSTHAYRYLKFLGREVTTSIPNRDEWDGNGLGDLLPTGLRGKSSLVLDWVMSGTVPTEGREINSRLHRSEADSTNRRAALISLVRKSQAQYAQAWSQMADEQWYKLPETWEMRTDIDSALQDIVEYVEGCS